MKNIIITFLCVIIGLSSSYAFVSYIQARKAEAQYQANTKPVYISQSQLLKNPIALKCMNMASEEYGVPSNVLMGIMSVEGGRIGQSAGPNFNGTYDLGPMQINTLWVPRLARLWNVNYRTAYKAVRDDGCENIFIGTWILKQNIAKTGNLYDGIAYYHSATFFPGTAYANKVIARMPKPTYVRR